MTNVLTALNIYQSRQDPITLLKSNVSRPVVIITLSTYNRYKKMNLIIFLTSILPFKCVYLRKNVTSILARALFLLLSSQSVYSLLETGLRHTQSGRHTTVNQPAEA